MKKFKFLEHTADVKFVLRGRKIEDIFSNCAEAISSIISRGVKIKDIRKKKISITGKDYESIMYKFIDELIYLLDAEGFLVSRAKIKLKDNILTAELYGDDSSKYNDLDSIKAATYAEMYVKQKKDKTWEAQVVVDV